MSDKDMAENCIFFASCFVVSFIFNIISLVSNNQFTDNIQQTLCTHFYTQTTEYKQCMQQNLKDVVKEICK